MWCSFEQAWADPSSKVYQMNHLLATASAAGAVCADPPLIEWTSGVMSAEAPRKRCKTA
jgi:hypothetical protein